MKFANFLKIFLKILVKIQLKKVIIYKSILENSKKDEPLKAIFATFANALCYFNATPLSVAVLAPCACGRNGQSKNGSSVWAGDFSLSLLALFGILKFLNALFLGFCALFVILSLCKKATQRVARRKPQQKNPRLKD